MVRRPGIMAEPTSGPVSDSGRSHEWINQAYETGRSVSKARKGTDAWPRWEVGMANILLEHFDNGGHPFALPPRRHRYDAANV